MTLKKLTVAAAGSALLLATTAAWAAPEPTYGTAVVDGAYGEWNLTNDFFANMYEAGNPTKVVLSKAYLRYDCNSKTMFVLVLDKDLPDGSIADDGAYPLRQPDDAWVKVFALGPNNQVDGTNDNGGTPTGAPPEFSWVPPGGVAGYSLEGWEGSFALLPGTYTIEIHLQFNPDRTSSSGRGDAKIDVSLQCDEPQPNPSIDIEKSTNGQDADEPTGPSIPVDDPVNWDYVVTNTGNVPLENVKVTDDQGVEVTCPKDILEPGESMTCTASGTATIGQYSNEGTAEGDYEGNTVSDSDPSHYFGEDAFVPAPAIDIEKSTNGEDADIPTGPTILAGSIVTWEYEVTNTGNVPLDTVEVTDNQGVEVTCPKDTLAPGESMTCTASGTATIGQYANKGTAEGDYDDTTVMDMDPSHYFGADPELVIEKSTQGQDADEPTGPFIELDDTVYWLYSVTNTGNVDLTNIAVTDNKLNPSAISCNPSNDNVIASLLVGQTKTCQALGTATVGQYENLGEACTDYTDDQGATENVCDDDPSHYFGAEPGIDIEKCTAGEALTECTVANPANHDNPPGAFFVEGDEVVWTYTVTNTGNVALSNVVVSDDQGVTVDCGSFDGTLDPSESVTCTASGTASLGQYANEGSTSGDYTVSVGPDGTPTTRTAEDMDPSHYYGFIKNRPSLEVFDLTYLKYPAFEEGMVNGLFTIENASDGPEVTAIAIESITMLIEYRTPAPKGKRWEQVPVLGNCTFDPSVPFILEDPNGTVDGAAQQQVVYYCTAAYPPDADVTSIRVTACVDIFNRDNKTFCTSSTEADF